MDILKLIFSFILIAPANAQIILNNFYESSNCGFGGFCDGPTKSELIIYALALFSLFCFMFISLPYIIIGTIKKVRNKNDKAKQNEAKKLIKTGIIIFIICLALYFLDFLIATYYIK